MHCSFTDICRLQHYHPRKNVSRDPWIIWYLPQAQVTCDVRNKMVKLLAIARWEVRMKNSDCQFFSI